MDNFSSIPLPKPDESPISLLYRCCRNNGFRTPSQLILNQRLRFSCLIHTFCKGSKFFTFITEQNVLFEPEANKIADAFFEPVLKDRETGIIYKGLFFPGKFVRPNLALCPSCVREGFLQNMHLFSWSNVCPQHNERYITSCPKCHAPLAWKELEDYHCPCRFDLRATESQPSSDPFHEILSHAVATDDSAFFTTVYELLTAYEYFRTPRNASTLTKACHQIALGGVTNFFEAITSLQKLYPSLHRIAFIAPLLKISDDNIKSYALQYLYTVSQKKPNSHPENCDCNKLRYSLSSAHFLAKGSKNLAHLISEKHLHFESAKTKYYFKKILGSDNLCAMLSQHPETIWDKTNSTPQPETNFKLITLDEGRQILQLSIADIITLVRAGKIKAIRLTSNSSALVSQSDIGRFSDNFVTLTNIRKSCILPANEVNALIRKISGEKISLNFRPTITIYRRSLLPQQITDALNKRDQLLQSSEAVMNFADAAAALKLDPKDITSLINLGVIKCKTHINSRRLKGRTMCLTSSVLEAKQWKEGYFTILETAELAKCDSKMITRTYLKSSFVPYLRLRVTTLILKADAERLIYHIKKYITMTAAMSKYTLSSAVIAGLIGMQKLNPLQSEHSDFVIGAVTFRRHELQTCLEEKYSQHSGMQRVSRTRNKFHPN
ncbi:hypothetical protein [Pseudomonas monteilii]|uniref:hypothetical protein n=1 Tax=Pseudomonas monteilii TaxID=76759 RepID=UPI003F6E08CD